MADECVIAVYPTLEKAQQAVHRLKDTGFPTPQISLATVGLQDRPELLEDLEISDDSLHDAAVAAELGALVGVLSGLAVMVLSGMGAAFLLGPVGGGIVGGVTGGYLGAILGWGVHKHDLQRYERLLKEGKVLVIANGNPVELAHAVRLLEETGASEVHTYAKAGDELPESP
jgi:hypothetical protein